MEAHQERVVQEHSELKEKLEKLQAFFNTELFNKLHTAEQQRLRAQEVHMSGYSNILQERIANF